MICLLIIVTLVLVGTGRADDKMAKRSCPYCNGGGDDDDDDKMAKRSCPYCNGGGDDDDDKMAKRSCPYRRAKRSCPYSRGRKSCPHSRARKSCPYSRARKSCPYSRGRKSCPHSRGKKSAAAAKRTQVSINSGNNGLAVSKDNIYKWIKFSKADRAEVDVDFSRMRMFVRYPCDDNVWFKLFVSSGHIELFSKTRGNIFCKEGGARNWYGGDRTNFNMEGVGCEAGNEYLVFVFEKTKSNLKIKNKGVVVYEQNFDDTDGKCFETPAPTTKIGTQVWKYSGNLGLAVSYS